MTIRILTLLETLALQAAVSNIEQMCADTNEDGSEPEGFEQIRSCWYDIKRIDEGMEGYVADSVELLESCGLLKRHPLHAHWVRAVSGEGE